MSHSDFNLAMIIATAAVAILMIVVALPVVLSMRHAAKDREFQHAERLKALEMGQPVPGERPVEAPPGHAVSGIGVWVPLGVMGIALAATHETGHTPAVVAIWVAAGSVGVAGVICGTILAMNAPSREAETAERCSPAKSAFGEDDVETVSRRG